MNKKIIVGIIVVLVLGVVYWLISPLWNNVALDEALPQGGAQATVTNATGTPLVKDNLESMTPETKQQFETETQKMLGEKMEKTEVMPTKPGASLAAPVILAEAPLVARAHEVEGKALLVQVGDKRYVRFENLQTINGPDLRIYLSADLGTDDIVDLGPIRATQGNVNYELPAGTDLTKYKNALIWCRAFGVLFSYAQL